MKDLGFWNLFMGQGGHPGPGIMSTLPMLTQNSREGIPVDRVEALKWTRHLERKLFRFMRLWTKDFAQYNPGSTKDIKTLFYKEWGLPIQRTKAGKEDSIAVDELGCMRLREYTKNFRGRREAEGEGWQTDPRFSPRVFDLLLALRETGKSLGTYAQPVAKGEQSRVYPQYLP